MIVSELKKILETVRDDALVVIFLPENVAPGKPDFMRYVNSAGYVAPSGINGPEFNIEAGEYFEY